MEVLWRLSMRFASLLNFCYTFQHVVFLSHLFNIKGSCFLLFVALS